MLLLTTGVVVHRPEACVNRKDVSKRTAFGMLAARSKIVSLVLKQPGINEVCAFLELDSKYVLSNTGFFAARCMQSTAQRVRSRSTRFVSSSSAARLSAIR